MPCAPEVVADVLALAATAQARFASDAGVNIDEEMSKLIELQTAYTANARVLTAAREVVDPVRLHGRQEGQGQVPLLGVDPRHSVAGPEKLGEFFLDLWWRHDRHEHSVRGHRPAGVLVEAVFVMVSTIVRDAGGGTRQDGGHDDAR